MARNGFHLRFAVGTANGPRSSVWRVRSYKSDVYIAPRDIMGSMKVSLHRDGNCFFKLTEQGHERASGCEKIPAIKWTRPRPDRLDASVALFITFPAEGLAPGDPVVETRPIIWLPAPAPGEAMKVGFFFLAGVPKGYAVRLGGEERELGYYHLDNGDALVVAARIIPYDVTGPFADLLEAKGFTAKVVVPGGAREPKQGEAMRGIFYGDPPASGAFELVNMVLRRAQ